MKISSKKMKISDDFKNKLETTLGIRNTEYTYIPGQLIQFKGTNMCCINPNKRISPGVKRQFNVGYLFLKKIYNELNIKNICNTIQDKYKIQFDLNEILSYLVFARIIC